VFHDIDIHPPRVDWRFEKRLSATGWWTWPREVLLERWRDLCNVELFLEKYAA
jgi:hypothetical protein